jgi:hypothetical protein
MSKILDKEDKNWRKNTILRIDGASYHTNNMIKTVLAKLQIPTIYVSPYSP